MGENEDGAIGTLCVLGFVTLGLIFASSVGLLGERYERLKSRNEQLQQRLIGYQDGVGDSRKQQY